jgi:hypothetical protein
MASLLRGFSALKLMTKMPPHRVVKSGNIVSRFE